MNLLNLFIDGAKVSAVEGQSVLNAPHAEDFARFDELVVIAVGLLHVRRPVHVLYPDRTGRGGPPVNYSRLSVRSN